jgi:transketolase
MSITIRLVPPSEFTRVSSARIDDNARLGLIADMARANTLAAVKRAGSGHLGSSFSAMEIVTYLYARHMNTARLGFDDSGRDVYFSSKGHDVPGLYAVLFGLGKIPRERFLRLRRYGGLDGHPHIGAPGIEANTGSLGMGISKGRGIAWAKRHHGWGGRVFVMVGDGEMQEGQNYEAFHSVVEQGINNLVVIMDHNKVQSDMFVDDIMPVGNLEVILQAMGWATARIDGHDFDALERVLGGLPVQPEKPLFVIADTIKGRGVSFMEHPVAMPAGNGFYRWHAGAPPDEAFTAAHAELVTRVDARLKVLGLDALTLEDTEPVEVVKPSNSLLGEPESRGVAKLKDTAEFVAAAYGEALLAAAERRPDLVVLDADLAADCRTRTFEVAYPKRFIQNGIAEQDMVSMAGGLARHGLLPVVNSFASFLCSRANEQIYNNTGEGSRIIYACHYAGLIPAGPGKSHQSIRDISLLGALPRMVIMQPANSAEARMVVDYAVDQAKDNIAIRLAIGPCPRTIMLPEDYRLTPGRGVPLTSGKHAVLFAYGPVMLHEALSAAELLGQRNVGVTVVNMPWLNRVDPEWLLETVGTAPIFVLDDHAPVGGLGDFLLSALVEAGRPLSQRFKKLAVEGEPACGTPVEALRHHRLDGASLASRIQEYLDQTRATS